MQTHPLAVSLAVNACLWLIVYTLGTPRFGTNDDTAMMLQAAGVSSTPAPTEYLLFTNVLIGKALKALYKAAPGFPWYATYLSLALFAANVALLWVALRRRPRILTLGLWALYGLLLGALFLLRLQFTVAACLLAAGGAAVILFDPWGALDAPESTRRPARLLPPVCGAILLSVAGMIRWDSLLLALAVLLPVFGVGVAWGSRREGVLRLAVLAAALLSAHGLWTVDRWIMAREEGWRDYREFNRLLCRFVDDRILDPLDPEGIAPALERAGWSLNDYAMLLQYAYSNTNLYNLGAFRAALDGVPSRKKIPVSAAVRELQGIMVSPWTINALLVAGVGTVLVRGRGGWLRMGVGAGMAVVLCAYLIGFRKPPPDRVYWPMFALLAWVPMITGAAAVPARSASAVWRRAVLVCLVLAVGVRGRWALASYRWQSGENREWHQWTAKTLAALAPRETQLYVVWGASYPWIRLPPFGSLQPLRSFRTYSFATEQLTPPPQAQLLSFGVHDVYRALVNSDTIFLVVNDPAKLALFRQYMRQHYGLEIEFRRVFQADVLEVFRVEVAATSASGKADRA